MKLYELISVGYLSNLEETEQELITTLLDSTLNDNQIRDIKKILYIKDKPILDVYTEKPEYPDKYWYIQSNGYAFEEIYSNCSSVHYLRYQNQELHKTEESAQFQADKNKFMLKYKRAGHDFTVEEWQDQAIVKVQIVHNYENGHTGTYLNVDERTTNSNYFKTFEEAELFLNLNMKDILKYCFGVIK